MNKRQRKKKASKEPMTSIELKEIVWKHGTERFLELFREQIKTNEPL